MSTERDDIQVITDLPLVLPAEPVREAVVIPADPAYLQSALEKPLPDSSHPYRPSVDLSVAVLCVDLVEIPGGARMQCNTIYAKESQGVKAEERCPKCGSAAAFEVRRVIR